MDDKNIYTILKYYLRRKARLDARGIRFDSVNMDRGIGWAYGIVARNGYDVKGMSPKEVFEILDKLDKGGKLTGRDKEMADRKKRRNTSKSKNQNSIENAVRTEKQKTFKKHDYPEKGHPDEKHSTKNGYIAPNNQVDQVKGRFGKMSAKDSAAVTKDVLRHVDKNYLAAQDVANDPDYANLFTFTSHGKDHIMQVVDKTSEALRVFENYVRKDKRAARMFGQADEKMLLCAALFHDTGMDGDHDNSFANKDYGKKGNALRKNHGINSAIHVLENRDYIEKNLGVNPDTLALLVMSHTKSQSGVKDVTNPEHWKEAITKLQEHVDSVGGVEFKPENAFEGGAPSNKNVRGMATMSACLRLGDANREAVDDLYTQAGDKYEIESVAKGQFRSAKDEVANSRVFIERDGKKSYIQDKDNMMINELGIGRGDVNFSGNVVLGERNMVGVHTAHSDKHGTLQEEITLKDGAAVPYCTARAIDERMGELQTLGPVLKAVKVRLTGVENIKKINRHIHKAYGDIARKYKNKVDLVLELDDGEKYVYDCAVNTFVKKKQAK